MFLIVPRRAGEVIHLRAGIFHADSNVKPVLKIAWDACSVEDLEGAVRLQRKYFEKDLQFKQDYAAPEGQTHSISIHSHSPDSVYRCGYSR